MSPSLHIDHITFCAQAVQDQGGVPLDVPVLVNAYWYALCMSRIHPFPLKYDELSMRRIAAPLDPQAILDIWYAQKLPYPLSLDHIKNPVHE